MDHMSGLDRKGSVILDVPEGTARKRRGPPLPFGSSSPEEEVLVLRTYGLCGLYVDQLTAGKERFGAPKVRSFSMDAK